MGMKLTEEQELIIDLLTQGCGMTTHKGEEVLDNMCMSSYEWACDYLERIGVMENINGRMYRFKKEAGDEQ